MRKLFYITHPDVQIDPTKPVEKWQLSPVGKERAKALGQNPFMKEVEILLFSPEVKAVQAASICASGNNFDRVKIDALKEFDRSSTGFVEQEKYMKNMEKFYEEPDKSLDGWESANDAQIRIVNCINEFLKNSKYNNIAVMGHGATATLYKCYIKNVLPSFEEDPKSQGKYFVVDIDSKSLISDWQEY